MDITQLILDDHHEQRRLFAILEQIDRADTKALGAIWARLAAFLEVHAEAEERHFYPALLRVGTGAGGKPNADDETEDAIKDHNEIRDAVAEVARRALGSDGWFAAVAGANKANSEHMGEEEREGLADFRGNADLAAASPARSGLRDLRGASLRRRDAGRQGSEGLRRSEQVGAAGYWRIASTWISRGTASGVTFGRKPRPNWLRWIVPVKSPPHTSRLSCAFS